MQNKRPNKIKNINKYNAIVYSMWYFNKLNKNINQEINYTSSKQKSNVGIA